MNLSQRHVLVPALTAVLGLALAGWAVSATAQQAAATGPNATGASGPAETTAANTSSAIAEVVVTGSRIRRASETSDTPLVSIGAAQIAAVGQTSLDTALAQMPQFAASQGQTITGDVQGATGFTGGQSYSDLRGLGPQRTLVLVDGQRLVPTNPNGSVDLNQIPMALLEGVQVITGGASAVYGSDAMAGVVNFQLRQHFQGVELSYQHGASTHGDGAQTSISMLMGGNFADHRGNAVVDLEYNERALINGWDRDLFTHKEDNYPSYSAGQAFNAGLFGGNIPVGAVNALLAQYPGTHPLVGDSSGNYDGWIGFNHDGSIFTTQSPENCVQNYKLPLDPPRAAGSPYQGRFISPDCTEVRALGAATRLIQVPSNRINVFSRLTYNLTDSIQAYGQLNFMRSNAHDVRSYDRTSESTPLYVPLNNPYVLGNPALQSLLAARTSLDGVTPPGNGPLQLSVLLAPFGQTSQTFKYTNYQVTGGLKGGIGSTDLAWNVFGSFGESQYENVEHGNDNFLALDTMMYGTANYIAANGQTCQGYAWNPLGDQPMSAACVEYASNSPRNTNRMQQKYMEADLTGTLFKLPQGDLKFAAGADYRGESFDFVASPFLSPATNAIPAPYPPEQIASTFDLVGSSSGSQNVREVYLELSAPLLTDKPFAKEVSLDVAGRHSQYDLFGGANTWKADLHWRFNSAFMFRGGFDRAIRAPSLQELYNPRIRAGAAISSDPCAFNSPYRAGANAAQVVALCQAQGVPAAFLGSFLPSLVDVPGVLDGNLGLKPEVANTYSLGFVLTPHFEAPMARELGVSVDYFHIKLNGAIAGVSAQTIMTNCFNGSGGNPGYAVDNFYCQQIQRDPSTGYVSVANQFSENIGAFTTDGVDVDGHWGFDLSSLGLPERAGKITLQSYITYLHSLVVAGVPGIPTVDYAGAFGDTLTAFSANGSSLSDLSHPRWKANTTLGYSNGPVSAALRWRYLGTQKNYLNGPDSGDPGISAFNYFDFDATWHATSRIEVSAGLTNLADKKPPLIAGWGDITDAATYDTVGRTYHVNLKVKFD
ncbi:MAG: TonB-dependent receptor [Proteobacteria bacterium]|nr:TonB-dependent receptor [Pseudomonadota bacterium]